MACLQDFSSAAKTINPNSIDLNIGVTVLAVSLHAMHQQLSQALQVVLRAAATHYATEVKGMSKQNNSPVNFA
jgi:hypothetical protein